MNHESTIAPRDDLHAIAGEVSIQGGVSLPPADPVPDKANIETASPDLVLGQATVPLEPPHTSHKAPPAKRAK
jgi:hypothetical protein